MTTVSGPKGFFHILNPNHAHRPKVAKYFKKHADYDFMWIDRTSHPTHLETVVEWAVRQKINRLAIWGGDGTINRTLQSLWQFDSLQSISITIVPVGTCNDFCRYWKFGSWKKALKLMNEAGNAQFVDVGLIETPSQRRLFLNNSGFGRTKSDAARKKPSPIKDLFSLSQKKIQISWVFNGIEQFESKQVLFGIVFNAPYFSSGLHFSKSINPIDGKLNAFFVSPQNKLQLLYRFFKGRQGRPLLHKHDLNIDIQTLNIESDENLFPQVDGETLGDEPVHKIRFTLLPNHVKMILPES